MSDTPWLLTAHLRHDRAQPGEFRLIDPAGSPVLVGACLGKADGQQAAKVGNPSRNPVRPYGDTPLGRYAPARLTTFNPPHPRLGLYGIELIGEAGPALAAMAERAGLWVHGGRGDGRLVPTYGCLRLLDRDMAAVARRVGGDLVRVTIAEVP